MSVEKERRPSVPQPQSAAEGHVMPPEGQSEKPRALRTGFTTGACAAAAAKAAVQALHTGDAQTTVDIGLPNRQRVSFTIARKLSGKAGYSVASSKTLVTIPMSHTVRRSVRSCSLFPPARESCSKEERVWGE